MEPRNRVSRLRHPRAGWIAANLLALAAVLWLAAPARAAQDFSAAERALFMSDQLANLKPPTSLRYSFRKSGSLEQGFADAVALDFKPQPDGKCCAASGQFLTGERQLSLPDIEGGQGNPVILYFLERDIREMKRLTQGSQNYFRKRIRMAVFEGASVKPASFKYRGRAVEGQEIAVKPYLDDPNRFRYDKLAVKEYRFLLSPAVPGGVYGIHTQIGDDKASLITEDLFIEGAEPTPAQRTP